jgi:hypothetical protein
MREEFEEWAQNESVYGRGFSLTQSHNNMDYLNSRSQSGWKAWQAATALQNARVRELEYSSDKRGVMLMMIREILNVLPDDCLGTGSMRDCAPYPIKAEVIDGIGKALSATARES